MKRVMKTFAALAIVAFAAAFTSCDNGGGDGEQGNGQIALTNSADKEQSAWADDEEKGVSFTAKSAWEASVTEAGASRASNVTWIKLLVNGQEKYSGGAGTVNIVIVIDPNTTGGDRSATITITCGGEHLKISVDQKGVTEEDKPLTAKDLIVAHPWKCKEFFYFYPDTEDDPDTAEDERYMYDSSAPGAIFTFRADNTVSMGGGSIPYSVNGNVLTLHATHENGASMNMNYNITKLTSTEFEATGAFQGSSQSVGQDEHGNEILGPITPYTYYQTYKFVKP